MREKRATGKPEGTDRLKGTCRQKETDRPGKTGKPEGRGRPKGTCRPGEKGNPKGNGNPKGKGRPEEKYRPSGAGRPGRAKPVRKRTAAGRGHVGLPVPGDGRSPGLRQPFLPIFTFATEVMPPEGMTLSKIWGCKTAPAVVE